MMHDVYVQVRNGGKWACGYEYEYECEYMCIRMIMRYTTIGSELFH